MTMKVLTFRQYYNAGLSRWTDREVIRTKEAIVLIDDSGAAYTAKYPGRGATEANLESFAQEAKSSYETGKPMSHGIELVSVAEVDLVASVDLADLHKPYPIGDKAYTALTNAGLFN